MKHWLALLCAGAMVITASPAPARSTAAVSSTVHTPAVGSAERNALLSALRTDPAARFTFKHLRVYHSGERAIAYAEGDNGIMGGFRMLLVREGNQPWRIVWGEGDGGSDSCAQGARHYRWAVNLIRSYGAAPNALIPGFVGETQALELRAKAEPDVQCVGDLEGGDLEGGPA